MKNKLSGITYWTVFFIVFLLDRGTKSLAVTCIKGRIDLTSFLSFDIILNRGISWGMMHSRQDYVFYIITGITVISVIALACYTIIRWMNHCAVIGEILILAGAISNIVDRIVYHGVIDFILFSYQTLSWPIFNVADVFIVVGVFIMFVTSYRDV